MERLFAQRRIDLVRFELVNREASGCQQTTNRCLEVTECMYQMCRVVTRKEESINVLFACLDEEAISYRKLAHQFTQ